MFTANDDEATIPFGFEAGADGYCMKDSNQTSVGERNQCSFTGRQMVRQRIERNVR